MSPLLVSLPRRERRHTLVFSVSAVALALLLVNLLVVGLRLPHAAYETVRTFVLDADPALGNALGGGWYATLWALRFAAPILTLGVVAEVVHVLGLFHLPTVFFRLGIGARDHVVVVGLGRLGQHLCRRLMDNGARVVAIERDADAEGVVEMRRKGVPVIVGDGSDDGALRRAGAQHARHVLAVTGNEIINLDAALLALHLADSIGRLHRLSAWAQVFDPGIIENVRNSLAPGFRGRLECFNSYAWAADQLLRSRLPALEDEDVVAVVGYGRFGSAVLTALAARTGDERPRRVVVVDKRLPEHAVGEAPWCRNRAGWDGRSLLHDLRDPMLLPELQAMLRGDGRLFVLVCTDDDSGNLRFAIRARGHAGGRVEVVTRVFQSLRSKVEANALPDIHVVELIELVGESWPVELRDLLAARHDRYGGFIAMWGAMGHTRRAT